MDDKYEEIYDESIGDYVRVSKSIINEITVRSKKGNEWVTVYDDDIMAETYVRKSDIVEISSEGYVYTRLGHKYNINEGYYAFWLNVISG